MSEVKKTGEEDHGEVVEHPRARISWAWVFPILAAAAAGWLFWSQWKSQGPEIEILFDSAPGLQAGKTQLIYRGMDAGHVVGLKLNTGLHKVEVRVRLQAFAAELAKQGTVFWIEQPVIALGRTSGLESLIQGNSLQARLGDGPYATKFEGLERPPLTPLEAPALVIKLRAPSIPFVSQGTPVYYHGVVVGKVEDKELDKEGKPYLHVVIDKDFKTMVRHNSRFWFVPATSLRVGPGGIRLDVAGLDTLLQGGIAFDTFANPDGAVENGTDFELSPTERAARCSSPSSEIIFDDGRGLLDGQTQVCYLGLPIGLVEKCRPDLASGKVKAIIRLDPAYESLQNAGTIFTLIRPHISLDGVTGLDTLITGVYIECTPGPPGEASQSFVGRTVTQAEWDRAQAESQGVSVTLRAANIGSLNIGAPVLFRGLAVGSVKEKVLDDKQQPYLRIIIRREFEKVVRANSRFWRVPAASAEAGPGVLKVDIAGVEALLQGGVAFDVFGSPGEVATANTSFNLFADEHAARADSAPIRIAFSDGQGLLAGETQLRYLGVPVGIVEKVTPGNGKVNVVARLERGFDDLQRSGATFTIVRPHITLTGVTGLETLVSGVYIECAPGSGRSSQSFTGTSPAIVGFNSAPGEQSGGLEIVVTTPSTTIGLDAPIYYRGVRVGKVVRKTLGSNGQSVGLVVAIDQPYAALVRENTKFWDISGFQASLGFIYVKVQHATVDTLVRGGMAFATPDNANMGPRVKPGTEFPLNKSPRGEWLRWTPTIPLKN